MELDQEISENLPLTETTFFIILSLALKPRHGYGIMKDVEVISEKRVQLSTGTLYGALRRLLEDGWIERVTEDRDAQLRVERNQKYYALTQIGRQVLEAEVQRLHKLLQAARLRTSETYP